MDQADNFGDGYQPWIVRMRNWISPFQCRSGCAPSLDHYREQLEKDEYSGGPDSQQAIAQMTKPYGTDFPKQGRLKRWIILSYINFSFADLDHINLAGVDMRGSDLNSANLAFADLTKVTLTDARLDEAMMWHAQLEEADMSRISATETDFGQADLRGAWLMEAYLVASNFYQAKLDGAFLMGADLSKLVSLSGASARRANFWRAILVNARIASGDPNHKVDLRGAIFKDADLRGAYFLNVDLAGADFTNANLDNAELTDVDLRYVKGLKPQQLSKVHGVSRKLLPFVLQQ